MEFNEFYFCSLWTEHFRIRNCADILLNKKLTKDYFFNRLTNITCSDTHSAIEEGVRISLKKGIDCCVYVPDDNRKLEEMLLGTVSDFRGQGIATKMVKVALEIAQQRGLDFIFLQAFANEGIIGFYNKLGFQTIYKKNVYAFPREE